MTECWSERPEQRPTFEQIRQRIATFLDVASDSYGYIQVATQEYQRLYGHVASPPRPTTAPSILSQEEESGGDCGYNVNVSYETETTSHISVQEEQKKERVEEACEIEPVPYPVYDDFVL